MNCNRCHHTDEAHIKNQNSSSIIKAGNVKFQHAHVNNI